MSSTLNRIKNIMSCNVKRFLDKNNKSESDIKTYIRKFESEIGNIKAQTESVKAEANRRKRALNECEDSILKMDRYIKRSIENGNSSDVRLFEDKKQAYETEKLKLEKAYNTAKMALDKMNQAENKISNDIEILRDRLNTINDKELEIKMEHNQASIKQKISKFEAEVNSKAAQAEGMREIDEFLSETSSDEDDLDKLFEELENDNK